MTICDEGGLGRAGRFAFEQVIIVSCGAADLRWALAMLALQGLVVIGANCRILLIGLIREAVRRIASVSFPTFVVRLGNHLARTSYR